MSSVSATRLFQETYELTILSATNVVNARSVFCTARQTLNLAEQGADVHLSRPDVTDPHHVLLVQQRDMSVLLA